MANQSRPTPIPRDMADRERYEFIVSIEGAKRGSVSDTVDEHDALATHLTGVLAKAYPDRWTGAHWPKYPRVIGASE